MELTPEEIKNLKLLEYYQKQQWFVEVVRLTDGQAFGELALINDKPRAATVMCLTQCYFATISREQYDKALNKIE